MRLGGSDGSSSEVVFTAMAAIPATAMVVTGHIWLGAATVAAVVGASMISIRHRLRARAASEREILSYAHTATSLGADPALVIQALRRPGTDGDRDEDDSGWVHLPARLTVGDAVEQTQETDAPRVRHAHPPMPQAIHNTDPTPLTSAQVVAAEPHRDGSARRDRWTEAAQSVRSTAPTVLFGTSRRTLDSAARRVARATEMSERGLRQENGARAANRDEE